MAVAVTKEILKTSYDLLRMTRPFNRMGLPPSEDIAFHVLRGRSRSGDHYKKDGKHHIRVSAAKHHTLHAILATVAHEMCHVADPTKAEHGWYFNRLADRVCKWHGFDRGQF